MYSIIFSSCIQFVRAAVSLGDTYHTQGSRFFLCVERRATFAMSQAPKANEEPSRIDEDESTPLPCVLCLSDVGHTAPCFEKGSGNRGSGRDDL